MICFKWCNVKGNPNAVTGASTATFTVNKICDGLCHFQPVHFDLKTIVVLLVQNLLLYNVSYFLADVCYLRLDFEMFMLLGTGGSSKSD